MAGLWTEFIVKRVGDGVKVCGLCGNTGTIHCGWVGSGPTMAFRPTKYCICPNGRALLRNDRLILPHEHKVTRVKRARK